MLERGKMDRGIVEIVDTESLVPRDHLLRKIDAAVDFNRLYEMVEPLYSEDNGRPSVDPVVLFKMVLIQHLYGLPSLRRTADEISANICYRWFLGYTLQEETPHFSTFQHLSSPRTILSYKRKKAQPLLDFFDRLKPCLLTGLVFLSAVYQKERSGIFCS